MPSGRQNGQAHLLDEQPRIGQEGAGSLNGGPSGTQSMDLAPFPAWRMEGARDNRVSCLYSADVDVFVCLASSSLLVREK